MNYDVYKPPEIPDEWQWPREQSFYGPRGLLGKLFEDRERGAITSRLWPLPDDPLDPWPLLPDMTDRFIRGRKQQMAELCVMHGAGDSAVIHMKALWRVHVLAGTVRLRRDAA